MCLLSIDFRNTVTYRDAVYPVPQGLAPYREGITGCSEIAAVLVARLGLRGHHVEAARYIEEEPFRAGGGPVWDSLGSRAMRVECLAGGRTVVWRYDRRAANLSAAWTVEVDGAARPVEFSRYARAHERYAALAWVAHRALRNW